MVKKEVETPVYKKYKSSSPSLKNIGLTKKTTEKDTEQNSKEQTKIDANRASTPFNQELLEESWLKFAESISKEMPRLYQVLKSNAPVLKDNFIIHLEVDNELQKKDIEDRAYSRITGWLKQDLNNYQIQLVINVSSLQKKKKMAYTATDKFNYLAEQNELLHKLKKNFGLDFE